MVVVVFAAAQRRLHAVGNLADDIRDVTAGLLDSEALVVAALCCLMCRKQFGFAMR